MAVPYTILSYLQGHRGETAKVVTRNPFFSALADRESAEIMVRNHGFPILRHSSHIGCYAITYYCPVRRNIIHTLFRQNMDLTIDVLNDAGFTIEHYATIYDLLDIVMRIIRPVPVASSPPGGDPGEMN